jgi:peroxiredoxin
MAEFGELDTTVIGAAVDSLDDAKQLQSSLSFPIAYGVTREQADIIGAWWGEERSIIQPSEFILNRDGTVLSSTYSSTPVGRIEPGDALKRVKFPEKKREEAAGSP